MKNPWVATQHLLTERFSQLGQN